MAQFNKGNDDLYINVKKHFGKESNAHKIFNVLLDRGFTPSQASGVVGNLMAESYPDIRPTAENDNGAIGIAQWLNRADNLKAYAAKRGVDYKDLDLQLDFMFHELNTTEKKSYRLLKKTTNPTEAAIIFEREFERAKQQKLKERIQYSNLAYKHLAVPLIESGAVQEDLNTSIEDISNIYGDYSSNIDVTIPYQPVKDYTKSVYYQDSLYPTPSTFDRDFENDEKFLEYKINNQISKERKNKRIEESESKKKIVKESNDFNIIKEIIKFLK